MFYKTGDITFFVHLSFCLPNLVLTSLDLDKLAQASYRHLKKALFPSVSTKGDGHWSRRYLEENEAYQFAIMSIER